MTAVTMPYYRDVTSVSEELGFTDFQVKKWAKESGCHSRVGNRGGGQIMFTPQDVRDLKKWLDAKFRVERAAVPAKPAPAERDLWGE